MTRTCSPTTGPLPAVEPGLCHARVADVADAAGVELDIKGGRHYTASQLLAGGFDVRNTAARLGHSGGGATTLRHYADPVSRGRPARRRLPRAVNRRIRNSERLELAVRQAGIGLFVPKPSNDAGCQGFGVSDLGSIVRRCSLASTPVGGDCH